jgi:chromosomal replication initiation ATPase DnaA
MLEEAGIRYNPALVARRMHEEELREARQILEDADKAALAEMRKRFVPQWARDIIVSSVSEEGVHLGEVLGASRRRDVVQARHRAMYLIKATKPGLSFPQIAKWFGKDHTSTLYAVAKYGIRNGLPAFTSSMGHR